MLELEKACMDIYEATRDDWNACLDKLSNVETLAYSTELDRLEEAAKGGDAEGHVYALIDRAEGSLSAEAILLIAHVEHGKDSPRMKVLNLRPHPRFDLDAHETIDAEFIEEWSEVISASLAKALGLTFVEHPSNELKLYARSEQMYGFFQAIAGHIVKNGGIEGLEVSCHSRWLVFKKKPPLKLFGRRGK